MIEPCPTRPELVKAIGDYADAYATASKTGKAETAAGKRLTAKLDLLYGRLDILERSVAEGFRSTAGPTGDNS